MCYVMLIHDALLSISWPGHWPSGILPHFATVALPVAGDQTRDKDPSSLPWMKQFTVKVQIVL